MTSKENELLTKIKEYVFDTKKRVLCDNSRWCGCTDGYCPTYDCGSLDKLKLYSDRQWLNTIKEIQNTYIDTGFEDLVNEVLAELRYKRPSGYKK